MAQSVGERRVRRVRCPVEGCEAAKGKPCISIRKDSSVIRNLVHDERRMKYGQLRAERKVKIAAT